MSSGKQVSARILLRGSDIRAGVSPRTKKRKILLVDSQPGSREPWRLKTLLETWAKDVHTGYSTF